MRAELLETLRCPRCHAERSLVLSESRRVAGEIREATLACGGCGEERRVERGIVDLLPPEVPAFVVAEAAGLDRFVDTMRAHGWSREDVLALPFRQDGYWYHQAVAMQQTLATVLESAPGKRILDVGANTCWASAMLAERGLDVIALDINANEMQGLATSDWWFEAKRVYFERVLGVMFDLPFATNSFDYVWCCEVLHHNHRSNLYRTLRELFRVLRPGGSLIVVNETCRSLLDPKLNPGHEVAQYEGHEHAYIAWSYAHAARRAGFDVKRTFPWAVAIFSQWHFEITLDTRLREVVRAAVAHTVRRVPALRRIMLIYRNYVMGASFSMIATKPGRQQTP
jgi:SAM-dependent methyltransferase/uncharacterized protein YbaR (Trm112 family)